MTPVRLGSESDDSVPADTGMVRSVTAGRPDHLLRPLVRVPDAAGRAVTVPVTAAGPPAGPHLQPVIRPGLLEAELITYWYDTVTQSRCGPGD